MLLRRLFLLLLTVVPLIFARAQRHDIIPAPQDVRWEQGTFLLTPQTRIVGNDSAAYAVAQRLAEKINRATRWQLRAVRGKARKGDIVFEISSSPSAAFSSPSAASPFSVASSPSSAHGGTLPNAVMPQQRTDEGYTLRIEERGVRASARSYSGLFYALQTLLQLLPPEVESDGDAQQTAAWSLPAVRILDAPRFSYRGVMLDPCRHFLPVEAVKRQIELLSAYKINRLHWHLTDDQGWRIEIKKYPQLTRQGAWRTEADGTRHGGYYTQAEIREVVEYARQHAVEIVPELEVPGHELAAIAAFPELSCTGQPTTPRIIWGVEEVVMCPGKERMFRFLEDVIDEMVQLFPGQLFHIGGDESPRTQWEQCPDCQARMKSLGYAEEAQLQSYIVGRVAAYLRTKGKTAVGWDEILEGGNLDPSAVVMSWRGTEGGVAAARVGHPVIMSPSSDGYYLDYLQGDLLTEPIAFSVYGDLGMTYRFEPTRGLAPQEAARVWGVQGNAWSEYIHNPQHLEYKIYPRALAVAEVGWTLRKDFADFCRRLDGEGSRRLQAREVNFHIPQPEQPGKSPADDTSCNRLAFIGDRYSLSLTATRPLDIVYTLDGTQPSARSPRYTAPLVLQSSTRVRTRCVLPCGILGPERVIDVQRETPRPPLPVTEAELGGIRVRVAWGDYTYTNAAQAVFAADTVVSTLDDVARLTDLPRSLRKVRNYAAMAELILDIPEEGVYEFSSHNVGVWIDDELLVDNRMVSIPRNSPNNAQIALSAGRHRLRTLFVGGIFHGWPTYWDAAGVEMRRPGEARREKVVPCRP